MTMDENTRVVYPGATRIARAAHAAERSLEKAWWKILVDVVRTTPQSTERNDASASIHKVGHD